MSSNTAKSVSYSDAYELMHRKILINKMSIESLNLQMKYSQTTKQIQDVIMETTKNKISLAEKLNVLFEQQLREFTAERQDECIVIYKDLNDLDANPSPKFMELYEQMQEYENKITDLNIKIEALEKTIPMEKLITQFEVKLKSDVAT